MEFKRTVYAKMLEWKNEFAPNYALFLKIIIGENYDE